MRWVPFLLFLSLFSLSLNAQMVFQFTNKTKLVADPSISSKAPLRACFRFEKDFSFSSLFLFLKT